MAEVSEGVIFLNKIRLYVISGLRLNLSVLLRAGENIYRPLIISSTYTLVCHRVESRTQERCGCQPTDTLHSKTTG